MALPFCIELQELDDTIEIPIFSFSIEGVDLLEQLQPLLAPLMPLFQIIDAVVALFNCVKAIPDSLGPPPDPTVLAACLPDLAEKIAQLLAMNPMLAIPKLIKAICRVIIRVLENARDVLFYLQQQVVEILAAIDRATNLDDAGLMALLACAQGNVNQEAFNIGKALASIGKLIGLINLLLGMVGLPEVPSLEGLAGTPLDLIIDPLDALIEVFEAVRDAIPAP